MSDLKTDLPEKQSVVNRKQGRRARGVRESFKEGSDQAQENVWLEGRVSQIFRETANRRTHCILISASTKMQLNWK